MPVAKLDNDLFIADEDIEEIAVAVIQVRCDVELDLVLLLFFPFF